MSEEATPQKSAILIDDNLMSAVRVKGQLQRAGYCVHASGVLPTASAAPGDTAPDMVLINLGSRSLKGTDLVTQSKTQFPQAQVLGFCGHTEIEIRRAAKAAGVGRIFTNEEAMLELAELLSR